MLLPCLLSFREGAGHLRERGITGTFSLSLYADESDSFGKSLRSAPSTLLSRERDGRSTGSIKPDQSRGAFSQEFTAHVRVWKTPMCALENWTQGHCSLFLFDRPNNVLCTRICQLIGKSCTSQTPPLFPCDKVQRFNLLYTCYTLSKTTPFPPYKNFLGIFKSALSAWSGTFRTLCSSCAAQGLSTRVTQRPGDLAPTEEIPDCSMGARSVTIVHKSVYLFVFHEI